MKILEILKIIMGYKRYEDRFVKEYPPLTYKICPYCGGHGATDFFTECDECQGTGFIRKTYQEYIDTLPSIDDK